MKLPYFKKRYYLSGIDWIISAIDYYMSLTTPAGNHSTLIVELDKPCKKQELQQRLELIYASIPLFNATLSRDIFNLAPYWKIASKKTPVIPAIETTECNSIQDLDILKEQILNTCFKTKKDHLFFSIISGKCGNYIVMTFDHKLLDARGAEIFLNLLSGKNESETEKLLEKIKTTDSPKLKDWNEKFKAGRDIQRHLIELSQSKYVALSSYSMQTPPEKTGSNLKTLTTFYSEKETGEILAKSEREAGFMMETPYLLAVTAFAIHKTVSPGKDANYSIPMPVDMRKTGSEFQKMLFNHLSFMFLNVKVKKDATLKDLICGIRKAIFYNIEQELPEKLIKATRLARISPLPVLKHFMKLPLDGKVASFAFANVGESLSPPGNLLSNAIKNISHIPRIPTPPGLGIFFSRYAGRTQFTLTWDKNAIEKDIAHSIIDRIKELLKK